MNKNKFLYRYSLKLKEKKRKEETFMKGIKVANEGTGNEWEEEMRLRKWEMKSKRRRSIGGEAREKKEEGKEEGRKKMVTRI